MNTAVAMLHSFWLVEARKTFESVVQADPSCGVAYWGVALTHFGNPFGGGPAAEGNQAGFKAAAKGASIGGKSPRDKAYIAAAQELYQDYQTVNNRTRMVAYTETLGGINRSQPSDVETAIFHSLWLVATAPPLDLTFAQQKRAAGVLN